MRDDKSYFVNQVDKSLQPVFHAALDRFQLGEMSIHGPSHWMKVFNNATLLAQKTDRADLVVCQLFALLHDCAREDDGSDLKHGPRAASYAKELYQLKKLAISQEQLDLLCYACEHHTDGQISNDPTIGVCWDADRLDLPRVGMRINARY